MDDRSSEYVVVARRYRPQTFDALIGQSHVARALTSAISSDRVGHAYLFTGARGVGKTSAARILAKALNCVNGPTPTPCNECDICRSVATGDDVDVLEIDGASNRGIDEIRQLRQNVAVRPTRVRFKVYIIDEVHMLTREAFNALLKTLEEPPGHVKFIFATTEPQKVPITILSRCQRFDFAGIDAVSIQQRLADIASQEGVQVEEEALAILARRAAGSMRDSQSLLEQLLAISEGAVTAADVHELLGTAPAVQIGEFCELLHRRDACAALQLLDVAIADGTDVGQFLEQLIGFMRDMLVTACGGTVDQFRCALPSQADQVRRLAESWQVHNLLAMVQILDAASARMRVSVDARTLVELATVRICYLPDLQDLAQLIGQAPSGQPAATGTTAVRPTLKKNDSLPSGHAPLAPATESSTTAKTVEIEPLVRAEKPPPRAGTPRTTADVAGTGDDANWNDAAAGKLWQALQAKVDGMLGGCLAQAARTTSRPPNRLIAWFDAKCYNFCKQQCETPENQQRIEAALRELAGRQVKLEFAEIPKSDKPPARPTSRRERLREIRRRPFVERALGLFADEAAEIKVTSNFK